ncbi:hypothetical protein CS022_18190 [Veronia nyctiphanis]|uniref:LRAT domain-containing protein n=2 Tax=Veronia nyctiphanis TaxID=1278244 RepID=A0A4Q0YMK3_9GAMM|nr:hypothetical protein CS022_18090 [Veronia nyctiphanis]RXJ72082.1 hypothetical protein CS022_18190 [Veronia nyctiphanis]
MLISATERNGTVREETWDEVVKGKPTYVADFTPVKSPEETLALARTQIGEWVYSVTSNNCEHFVRFCTGLEVTSRQVTSAVGGAVAGASLVGLLAEKPTAIKYLAGALAVAGIAVLATKATEKKE